MDSRVARSWGGVRLSARTHSTDAQSRHVDRHRPRTRTQPCAHQHPQPNGPTKRGHRRETATRSHGHTKAQADARPRTQIHKDSQTRDARVGTKTLEAPAPAPSLGPSLCLLEALSLWSRSPSRRTPGIWRPLLTPWVQEKLRGPIPVPLVQRRPLARWGGQVGVGGSTPSPAAQAPAPSKNPQAPTWKPAPLPPRDAHPGGRAAGPPAGAFLCAVRPAPWPPPVHGRAPRPPHAQWLLRRQLRDLGSVAKVSAFPGALPAPRSPAEPARSPRGARVPP